MRLSPTRVALDAWIAHAEELLQEQRERNGDPRQEEEQAVEHGHAA